jgi:hypothetical protein
LDLSFANEQWRNTVCVGKDTGLIHRKHLEICIFSSLASELKTGDLCVKGSENYADYRDQLLPWQECEPMVTDYCEELGFPSSATDFVHQLKQWLTETAETVDLNYPDNGQVLINEAGEPIMLSPYLTRHIKRFGEYVLDLENVPPPIEGEIPL